MNRRVLIVEDNPIAARMWSRKLKSAGYETRTAQTGQDARKQVAEWRPDAVLLDMVLPETDGLELCREWKRNPETADLKIVFVSALHSRRDIQTALEAGADGYVPKSASAATDLVPALEAAFT